VPKSIKLIEKASKDPLYLADILKITSDFADSDKEIKLTFREGCENSDC